MALSEIERELSRIGANHVQVLLDDDFDRQAGTLVKIELETAYWHLYPERFLQLLKDLPDDAGDESVREVIERAEIFVWHGPSPHGSRDTSN